jgi:plasmid stabilization system protein ParE
MHGGDFIKAFQRARRARKKPSCEQCTTVARRGMNVATSFAQQPSPFQSSKEITMPRGDKGSYSNKQKRQAEHIEESYENRGVSSKTAAKRAWATVNKESGGGKKSGSGRKSATKKAASKKPAKKAAKKAAKKTSGRTWRSKR